MAFIRVRAQSRTDEIRLRWLPTWGRCGWWRRVRGGISSCARFPRRGLPGRSRGLSRRELAAARPSAPTSTRSVTVPCTFTWRASSVYTGRGHTWQMGIATARRPTGRRLLRPRRIRRRLRCRHCSRRRFHAFDPGPAEFVSFGVRGSPICVTGEIFGGAFSIEDGDRDRQFVIQIVRQAWRDELRSKSAEEKCHALREPDSFHRRQWTARAKRGPRGCSAGRVKRKRSTGRHSSRIARRFADGDLRHQKKHGGDDSGVSQQRDRLRRAGLAGAVELEQMNRRAVRR